MALPQVSLPTYELEVPSTGKTLKYRPFVVKEEKLLLLALESEDEKQIEDATKTLLKNCITSRVKLEDLALFDLEYIFLNIRAVSVGEVVEMLLTCEDDGETQIRYDLNLTAVEVFKPEDHSSKIMLSDEMGVIMKYPSFEEFVKVSIIGKDTSDEVIDIMGKCIDQIFDGEEVYDSSTTSKKEFVEFVENLTNKQFDDVQNFFTEMPVLKHEIKLTNPNTGVENTFVIQGLSNFFG
jgi:5,10-methenyltetrahydromethanopterin hydrogenase